jgi:hypothetical protein
MNDSDIDSRDVSIAFLTWELAKALAEVKRLKTDVRDYKADNARISEQWDRLCKERR